MNDPKADILISIIKHPFRALSFCFIFFLGLMLLGHLSNKQKMQQYNIALSSPYKTTKCGYYQGWRNDSKPLYNLDKNDLRYRLFLFDNEKNSYRRDFMDSPNFGNDHTSQKIWNELKIGQRVCLTFSIQSLIAITKAP